ncbi:hypothetical protein RRG08_038121 [Elysia crispata]|uniref:Uncharacterized protein n=1 Tax=Elysia crispata TaxID=231223 RepID=A0AAE0ZYG3_9GAST|nr:hypothetical protein RRG08_038121 [Elysia crispata]
MSEILSPKLPLEWALLDAQFSRQGVGFVTIDVEEIAFHEMGPITGNWGFGDGEWCRQISSLERRDIVLKARQSYGLIFHYVRSNEIEVNSGIGPLVA